MCIWLSRPHVVDVHSDHSDGYPTIAQAEECRFKWGSLPAAFLSASRISFQRLQRIWTLSMGPSATPGKLLKEGSKDRTSWTSRN